MFKSGLLSYLLLNSMDCIEFISLFKDMEYLTYYPN